MFLIILMVFHAYECLPACMNVHHVYAMPKEPGDFSGAGLIDSCDPPCGWEESILGLLEE